MAAIDKQTFIANYIRDMVCERKVRPPTQAGLATEWDKRVGEARGRPGYYPYMEGAKGAGPFIELVDGSIKLDFITGIGVNFFGFAHPELKWACIEALMQEPSIMPGNLQYSQSYVRLAENFLVAANARKPTRLGHTWITSAGAMANENALKMVRQKRAPGYKVLTFHHAFFGRTQTMAELTDNAAYREGLPLFDQVTYLPFYEAADPQGSLTRTLTALEKALKRAEDYAVFATELVQGEGGFNDAPRDFFVEVFERCRHHKIPIWIDEIQTFGRTGEFFGFQRLGLEEWVDIVTAGKMSYACATLLSKELNPRAGLVSGTFAASTMSIAAGNWVLRTLSDGGYLGTSGKIRQLEMVARDELTRLSQNSCRGKISGITAVGGMVAFQVMDGTPEVTKKFLRQLYDNGVIAFTCGHHPVKVRFLLPAGVLTREELLTGLRLVEQTVREVS